jgi:phosphohistidine phosphatase
MKRLILMRHAKSDWSQAGPDIERPLNPRGRRAAPVMGAWLTEQRCLPETVLCSPAVRTRETWERLGLDAPLDIVPALYHATPATMLEVLRGARGETVLMLGHNPGIGAFADALLQRAPGHPRFAAYPTCATLVAAFDIDGWPALRLGTGTADAFAVPRDFS